MTCPFRDTLQFSHLDRKANLFCDFKLKIGLKNQVTRACARFHGKFVNILVDESILFVFTFFRGASVLDLFQFSYSAKHMKNANSAAFCLYFHWFSQNLTMTTRWKAMAFPCKTWFSFSWNLFFLAKIVQTFPRPPRLADGSQIWKKSPNFCDILMTATQKRVILRNFHHGNYLSKIVYFSLFLFFQKHHDIHLGL